MIKLSTGAFESMLSTASFADSFANGVLCIYSGTQPSSADGVETGTLLAEVNVDAADFTPGGGVGINFAEAVGRVIEKSSTEVWRGVFVEDGTMGWFRLYDNNKVTGESSSAVRMDGSIGTSRTDIILKSTQATQNGSITFDEFKLDFSI